MAFTNKRYARRLRVKLVQKGRADSLANTQDNPVSTSNKRLVPSNSQEWNLHDMSLDHVVSPRNVQSRAT